MTHGELIGRPINLVDSLFLGSPGSAFPDAAIARTAVLARVRRGGLPILAGVTGPVSDAVRNQLMREYAEGVLYHEVGQRHD